ncbi:MAG: HEAT repeat domain-containing protein [Planctomycetes bacterium]|nr:HEAT repeat domain-containing protein [Planctomycetota bacterium]
MATNPFLGAALAALFSLGLTAQDGKSFEQHMAAAKFAQTRGDYATALKELRAAQAIAPADQREQLQRTVKDLADSMGVDVARAPKAGDPVQRLIAVLDTGSRADAAVNSAYDQLSYLGALVVPPLLDAVPTFGPFGLRNALQLLAVHDDVRIAEVLARRLDNADPAVTAAIANFLDDAQPRVAVPLAVKVATISKNPAELLQALRELVDNDRENPAARAAATALSASESPKVLSELFDAVAGCNTGWTTDVIGRLRQRGDDKTRAFATFSWLKRQADLSQDRALEALKHAPTGSVCWLAAHFAVLDPTWNRVALLALRSSVGEDVRIFSPVSFGGFGRVAWGDLRDEAGTAMLAVPRNGGRSESLCELGCAIIEAGWKVPEGSELSLVEMLERRGGEAWQLLLSALPDDGEVRAITLWRTLSRDQQEQLAFAAKDRPWHRLIADHLLAAEQQIQVSPKLLDRDWTGVPAPVCTALAKLATRWPTPPVGWSGWQSSLVAAWARTPQMPAEVILPLIAGGDTTAWRTLNGRDPEAALAWLRTSTSRKAVDPLSAIELLRRFGIDQDVPIGIWAAHQLAGQPPNGLYEFFADHGRGNLDVIALGKLPVSTHTNLTGFCVQVAKQAAQGARIDDLEDLLEMAPDLGSEAADAALHALRTQVRPNDTKLLLNALEATFTRPDPARNSGPAPFDGMGLAVRYLGMLEVAANPAALPRLREMLSRDGGKNLREHIALTCLRIGGDNKRAMLADFLKSDDAGIVAAALTAPELGDDKALREAGVAAMLRLGEQMHGLSLEWRTEDRERAAQAVVNDARFPQFGVHLSQWAIRELGSRKDTTFLKELEKATRHGDVSVRCIAATALGSTFSREAAPILLELLKDDTSDVQKAAQAALDRIANYLEERKKWEERLK